MERRDDWHNSVDERLVNLNSAQKSTDKQLDDMLLDIDKLDKILRGSPEEKLPGILADLDRIETQINKFNAILQPDSLGNGGLRGDVKMLLGKRSRSEKREGYFWAWFTVFTAQFLILIGLLIVNWDRIQEYIVLHQHIREAAAIERTTKKLIKARRGRKAKRAPAAEVPREPVAPIEEAPANE